MYALKRMDVITHIHLLEREQVNQVCADGNQYRGVCVDCDIKINRLVMNFMLIPGRTEKINKYIKERKLQ